MSIGISDKTSISTSISEYKNDDANKIKDLSNQFESLFLGIVVKSMRKSVVESELVKKSNGEKIFQGMLDQEYSQTLAKQRTTGIAESIEKHLLGINQQDFHSVQKKEAILRYSNNQDLIAKER